MALIGNGAGHISFVSLGRPFIESGTSTTTSYVASSYWGPQ